MSRLVSQSRPKLCDKTLKLADCCGSFRRTISVSGDRRGDAVGSSLSTRRRSKGRRRAERAGVTPRIARTILDRGATRTGLASTAGGVVLMFPAGCSAPGKAMRLVSTMIAIGVVMTAALPAQSAFAAGAAEERAWA